MKQYRKISKLILRKSNSYLKISLVIFTLLLTIIATAAIILLNQYCQVEKDFIKNENLHIIEISSKTNKNEILPIKYSFKNDISELISNKYPDVKFTIIFKYIKGAISDKNGDPVLLTALDDNAFGLLSKFKPKDNEMYTNYYSLSKVELRIPIVTKQSDGSFISNKSGKLELDVIKKDFNNNPFLSFKDEPSPPNLVSLSTFKKASEIMSNLEWDKIVKNGNIIDKAYIYVDELKLVETIAKVLNDNKYNTNYVFKSFDSFTDSMGTTFILFAIMAFMIFFGTIINVILAFNSYIKIQQKDIGILKYLGYSTKSLLKIYGNSINQIFIKLGILMIIYISILGLIFLKWIFISVVPTIILLFLTLLFIINRIIHFTLLRKYINKELLELIKLNKEFE